MIRLCQCGRHFFHVCVNRMRHLGVHAALAFLEYHAVDLMFRSATGVDATHFIMHGITRVIS
jgi:hypothetical protein